MNRMRQDNNTTVNGGIGFAGLLTIAFIVLKLIGIIEWSWLWVLSPIWISIAIVLIILIVVMIAALIAIRR